MGKRDLEKEKQLELAAIWGSEVDGDSRYPKRRRGTKKLQLPAALDSDIPIDPDVLSDIGSDVSEEKEVQHGQTEKKGRKSSKKEQAGYRLHCFVEPGTEKNAVRTVFEAYEPKVEIRVTQKGNLLNKSQYAVLTFRNKAMALHAVKILDGSNQRDLLGVTSLKLNLMLSRQQSKLVHKKVNRQLRKSKKLSAAEEAKQDADFIKQFMTEHLAARGK